MLVWVVKWLVVGGWRGGRGGEGEGKGDELVYLISPMRHTSAVEDEFVVGWVLEALFAVPANHHH